MSAWPRLRNVLVVVLYVSVCQCGFVFVLLSPRDCRGWLGQTPMMKIAAASGNMEGLQGMNALVLNQLCSEILRVSRQTENHPEQIAAHN